MGLSTPCPSLLLPDAKNIRQVELKTCSIDDGPLILRAKLPVKLFLRLFQTFCRPPKGYPETANLARLEGGEKS